VAPIFAAVESSPLDYLAVNTAHWTQQAEGQYRAGRRNWAGEPHWGVFHVPESEVHLLPPDADGLRVVELGCGTAYVSSWLARRGARPVGVDPTASQLQIAGAMQEEFGLRFPLVRAPAERLPFADGSFDLAVSEYGAAIWADPYRWIPEAARVLRPGGELVFLGNSALLMLCAPDADDLAADERMIRPQFGMHRVEWSDGIVEFHLSHGDWIRLFRAHGFEVLDLVELRPAAGAQTAYTFVTAAWARQWPCEEVWRVKLTAGGPPRQSGVGPP
jgi:SAM-dependent methyltransferase